MKRSLLSFGLVVFFAGLLLACSGDGGTVLDQLVAPVAPDSDFTVTPVLACNQTPHSATISLSGSGSVMLRSNDKQCSDGAANNPRWELPRYLGQTQKWEITTEVNGHRVVIWVSVISGYMGASGYVIEPDGTHTQVTNRWTSELAEKFFDVSKGNDWLAVNVHFWVQGFPYVFDGIEFSVRPGKF